MNELALKNIYARTKTTPTDIVFQLVRGDITVEAGIKLIVEQCEAAFAEGQAKPTDGVWYEKSGYETLDIWC